MGSIGGYAMDYERLRELYFKIRNGKSTKEERLEFLDNHLNLGGMSEEWFLSILKRTTEDPSQEEIDEYKSIISNIIINDI